MLSCALLLLAAVLPPSFEVTTVGQFTALLWSDEFSNAISLWDAVVSACSTSAVLGESILMPEGCK